MPETAASRIDTAQLSITDAARLLTTAGSRIVTEAMLQQDIDAGAPTNADGTLNLVNYTAWQVREAARGD